MSLMYVTVPELASYLKKDLDTATATLAIQVSSELFKTRAATAFTPTAETWSNPAPGMAKVRLPFRPIVSIDEVRIVNAAGHTTVLTDYTRIRSVLYRAAGFGSCGLYPPDEMQVDLHWGYAAPGDDVRGAVLETAATGYQSPDVTVGSESIDDYSYRAVANVGGIMLTPSAATLADLYRGTFAA